MPTKKEIQTQLNEFGASVRRERTWKGLTQERLAELVDLNIRTVQKIEAGRMNILLTTVIRIQRALDCPWQKLIRK